MVRFTPYFWEVVPSGRDSSRKCEPGNVRKTKNTGVSKMNRFLNSQAQIVAAMLLAIGAAVPIFAGACGETEEKSRRRRKKP